MTVYNSSKAARVTVIVCAVIFLAFAVLVLIFGDPLSIVLYLIAGAISSPFVYKAYKSMFCSFVICEKGITKKYFGKNVFSAWDEFTHIGVGEKLAHTFFDDTFRFALYFSKELPEKIYFTRKYYSSRTHEPVTQNENFYFIRYREGLLEEVLKYVDERRIYDIDRIRTCPDPHETQDMETSKTPRNELGFWDR